MQEKNTDALIYKFAIQFAISATHREQP